MKLVPLTLSSLFMTAAFSFAALADQPGADWISKDKAETALKAVGYTQITKIEADDGHWEGEGLKSDGKKYEFHVDPHNGTVLKDKLDD